jgi:hypothetical protein
VGAPIGILVNHLHTCIGTVPQKEHITKVESDLINVKWMMMTSTTPSSTSTGYGNGTGIGTSSNDDNDDHAVGSSEILNLVHVDSSSMSLVCALPRALLIIIGSYLPWWYTIQFDSFRAHTLHHIQLLEARVQRVEQQLIRERHNVMDVMEQRMHTMFRNFTQHTYK